MTLKDLLETGSVRLARDPAKNDYLLDNDDSIDITRLDKLKGYTVPLIAHDYGAKTPVMWNTLYDRLGLPLRNIMVVGNPDDSKQILDGLRHDPKYLGGGAGVGFKEKVIPHLDAVYPEDLQAVNIIINDHGKLIGYNTDALGFVMSLEESLAKVGKGIGGSNFVVYGAGGVAKEVTKLLADKRANHIRIVNRTYSKAVELANFLNKQYRQVAIGIGEDMSRGVVLNSEIMVDALINLSDKGSDGPLMNYAMYKGMHEKNETLSRTILRELRRLRPKVVIADIVLNKVGNSISLCLAEAEGIENLLDGKPMVINQAAPAYVLVQDANPDIHTKKVGQEEALAVFREAAG